MIVPTHATECVFGSKNWLNIGKLIYLISKGSYEGYKLWLLYSKYDTKNFNENHCYHLWADFDLSMPEDFEDEDEYFNNY